MIQHNYYYDSEYKKYDSKEVEFDSGVFIRRTQEFSFELYTIKHLQDVGNVYQDLIHILPIYMSGLNDNLSAYEEEAILKNISNSQTDEGTWGQNFNSSLSDDYLYMNPKLFYTAVYMEHEKSKYYLFKNIDEAIDFSKRKILSQQRIKNYISNDDIPF